MQLDSLSGPSLTTLVEHNVLFGSTPGKSAEILMGQRNKAIGEAAVDKFANNIPGMKEFVEKQKQKIELTQHKFGRENGFVRGIDGRILFCDQPRKVLMTHLQALEGLTCKAAAVYLWQKLDEEGIEHEFLLHYHDECCIEVHKRHEKRAMELAEEAFQEAPKWFGVMCMGGNAKSGKSYAEIH